MHTTCERPTRKRRHPVGFTSRCCRGIRNGGGDAFNRVLAGSRQLVSPLGSLECAVRDARFCVRPFRFPPAVLVPRKDVVIIVSVPGMKGGDPGSKTYTVLRFLHAPRSSLRTREFGIRTGSNAHTWRPISARSPPPRGCIRHSFPLNSSLGLPTVPPRGRFALLHPFG